jgi:hypothetical protein
MGVPPPASLGELILERSVPSRAIIDLHAFSAVNWGFARTSIDKKKPFFHDRVNMLDSETAEFKTYLNSLTTRELVKMADEAGIDIPPDLERIFIIRELLDTKLDEGKPAEILIEKPNLKTAELPRQYHISYLEILPRDPQWVYVFWEIKPQDREKFESDPRFEGYALKALEQKTGREKSKENEFTESFTVPVDPDDNSWYLGFPRSGVFRIALWLLGFNTPLIVSRTFTLPRFLNSHGNEEYLARPLIRLSGAADFAVLRDAETISYYVYE